MRMTKLGFKWCAVVILLVFALTGCPRSRSCIDTIVPPGCVQVGRQNDVFCCWLGSIYRCDLLIYRDSRGVQGYRSTAISECDGPYGRCRAQILTCK
jgi:hypothetical protein